MSIHTTVCIHEDTHKRLIKTRATLELKDGKNRTIEEAINEVLDFFEKNKERIK